MQTRSVHVIARMKARKDKADTLKAALSALIGPTRNEAGCIAYYLLNNRQAPEEFTFVEQWENEQALQKHLSSEHIKNALGQMDELLEAPPDIQQYDCIA